VALMIRKPNFAKVGGHVNNFRLLITRWACSPLPGTAPKFNPCRVYFVMSPQN